MNQSSTPVRSLRKGAKQIFGINPSALRLLRDDDLVQPLFGRWELRVHLGQNISDDLADDRVAVPFLVSRNHVPGEAGEQFRNMA